MCYRIKGGLAAFLAWAVLAWMLPWIAQGADNALDLRIRDAYTGYGVAAHVEVTRGTRMLRAVDAGTSGAVALQLPPGRYQVRLSAPGYAALDFSVAVSKTDMPGYFPLMHPVEMPKEMRAEAAAEEQRQTAKARQPQAVLRGYVVDEASGQPLSGVLVEAKPAGLNALSDARGYFRLELPVTAERETLAFSLAGYTGYQISHIPLTGDGAAYRIQLHTGSGMESRQESHPLDEVEGALDVAPALDLGRSKSALADAGTDQQPLFADPLPSLQPPASIRVGTSCKTSTNCAKVYAMPLEVYVASGVTREWLASWPYASVAAGAVAYRSYGAYFVSHPKSAQFDICNTTACQAWSPEKAPALRGLNAAKNSRGFMLTPGYGYDAIKSEYSAVNNDLANAGYCYKNRKKTPAATTLADFCTKEEVDSQVCVCQPNALVPGDWKQSVGCGDGYAGKPAEDWWCLADSVLKGEPRTGHGRGMSQVGSKRWAQQGKPWSWILWHYYQETRQKPAEAAGGDPTPYAFISSSVDTSIAQPTLSRMSAGIVEARWKVKNLNADSLPGLLLRVGELPELALTPIKAKPLTLAAGEQELAQNFALPKDAPFREYQVELWLDADGSGRVEASQDLWLGKGTATLSQFTKIANDGSKLPDSALLGSGRKDWACTQDNSTGLIWEVKTDDGGFRDWKWKYRNYDPAHAADDVFDESGNLIESPDGIFGGFPNPDTGYYGQPGNNRKLCRNTIAQCTDYAYTNLINRRGLCNAKNWHIPTINEFNSNMEIYYHNNGNYFPNYSLGCTWSRSEPNLASRSFPIFFTRACAVWLVRSDQ